LSTEKDTEDRGDGRPADPIAELLHRAGPRPEVPAERAERVKAVVRDHWERRARAGARKTTWIYAGAAIAATIVIVIVSIVLRHGGGSAALPSGPVAAVEAVQGAVSLVPARGAGMLPLSVGDSVSAGMIVETGAEGRVAFRLTSGSSLRVSHATRLRMESDSVLVLDRGTLYVDNAGADGAERSLEVRAPAGVVRDIGTQFEVYSAEDSLRVRVREGMVVLETGDDIHQAEPGVELLLSAGGALTRRTISPYGTEWGWTHRIAPPFSLEGRSLSQFLDWVARESGRSVTFADEGTESAAQGVVLHGSIEGLTPEEALAAVLPTCGMLHLVNERILIERAPEGTAGTN
jgi:ferric-dicitrate binding protein FerR (iron transport regulator)